MRISHWIQSLVLFAAIPFIAGAQDDNRTFYIVDYMKTTPGNTENYIKIEKEVWKSIHQQRRKNGNITSWHFYEVRYPAGADTEYDYVIVTTVKGWNGVENFYNGWESAMSALTKEQSARIGKTEDFRQLVRHEVWTDIDAVHKENQTTPSKYVMANFMSIPDERWEEYINMETSIAKPLHQENIKEGKRNGWGLYSLIMPYGDEIPYHAVTIDFYADWGSIGSGGDWGELLKKLHPNKSESYILRQINETRTLLRGELRVLLDYVQ